MRSLLCSALAAIALPLSTSAAQMALQWTDNSNNESGFRIERSTAGGGFSEIATVPANQTSYVDQGLKDGVEYRYRVRAYNTAGSSGYSNVALFRALANLAPTVGTIAAQTLSGSKSIVVNIADVNLPASSLVLSAASSNPSVLSASGVKISGTGSQRTITLQPTANVKGTSTVTLAVNDGDLVTYRSFTVTAKGTKAAAARSVLSNQHRIVSGSLLTRTAGYDAAAMMDFEVVGGAKNLLFRAVGPGLSNMGMNNGAPDAALLVMRDSSMLSYNDNWTVTSLLSSLFNSVGAFPLPLFSRDAVASQSSAAGEYTLAVYGISTGSKDRVLAEIYDGDTAKTPSGRLGKIVAEATAGGANGTMRFSLSVKGSSAVPVLVRGVGRGLLDQGVAKPLPRHRLEVYKDSQRIHSSDRLDTSPAVLEATVRASAPLLTRMDDTAALLQLSPGAYTVELVPLENGAGTAAVEVYDAR